VTASALRVGAYRFRATFRRRRGEYVTLVVLIGLLGGVALAAIAGARRTQGSYVTYLGTINASDLQTFTGFANPALGSSVGYDPRTDATILHLPFVGSEDTVVGFDGNLAFVDGAHPHMVPGEKPPVIEGALGGEYTTQDRVHVVAGRLANPNDPHEAIMNERAALESGLRLGSVVRIGLNSDAQEIAMSAPTGPSNLPAVKVLTVKMVGLGVFPQDVDEDDYGNLGSAEVLLSPAATRQIATCCAYYSEGFLKLADGSAHLNTVESELSRGRLAALPSVGFQTYGPAITQADRAIEPVAVALGAFGALAGLSLLVVALQVTGRQLRRHAGETATLRALGAGPTTTTADAVTGIIGAVAIGGALAVAVAVALSPLFPLGPVRPVYPVGVAFDPAVLALGFGATFVVLSGAAVFMAHRLDLRLRDRPARILRRSPVGTRLATSSGLSVAAVTGVRFALEPGEGDPVPVRSAILGATLAVVVVLSTVVFGASLNNLVTHPNLYGWNWDYAMLSGFAGDEDLPAQQSATLLEQDKDVVAASGVWFSKAKIDGQTIPVLGTSLRAAVAPPLLSGHAVQAPNQIVLGAETMAGLGKQVGDTVTVNGGRYAKSIRLTIVGTATLPALVGPGMGIGAIVDYRLIPASVRNTQNSPVPGPNAYLIRTDGLSVQALGSLDEIVHTINLPSSPSSGSAGGVVSELRPEEIVNSHSIVVIPAVLGASLAVGAALALGTTLVASVRRRRRDLAVLKMLGLSGRQLGTIIVWQSSVTVVLGTIIGVPLGIILGHVLWNGFAEAINAVPVTSIPPLYVAAVAVGPVVLANIVAAVPARFAARTHTAILLRAE
jgi:hypothetical protein